MAELGFPAAADYLRGAGNCASKRPLTRRRHAKGPTEPEEVARDGLPRGAGNCASKRPRPADDIHGAHLACEGGSRRVA
ncbi:hypothetical protein GCM10010394_36870 [Streptomyces crystallinus]|uniref:Uncharacterized protein n=1 Tax=Streptomyces crystallinus TaxID=68191 RepID=A0ABP3R575_9ACTN